MTKDIAIMSGYVRYRPIKKSFLLMINSRILSKHIMSKGNNVKANICRDEGLFVVDLDKKGNKLSALREKETTISISSKILYKQEIGMLKKEETKFSFPVKVIINTKQFGLNKYFFYPDKDAAKLAYELERLNIKIPNEIMTPHSFDHDLEFNYNSKKIIIEITQKLVSSIYEANFKHQMIGGNIRAHIFDIYRKCVLDKLLKKNKFIGFVILDSGWENIKHINEIIEECKLVNCHILFTKFSDKDWKNLMAKKILNIIRNESRNFKEGNSKEIALRQSPKEY